MSRRRVVVTGMGVLCPIGNTVDEAWRNALAGKSGAGPIEQFDASDQSVRFSCAIKDFDVGAYIDRKEARRMDGFIQYGMVAGIQAIQDAGLDAAQPDPHRIGVAIGSGIGGIVTIEAAHTALTNGGPRKVSPFFVPSSIINMISGNLSIRHGFAGPNIALVTACTTGTHNLGLAARLIQAGDADVMIAGGSEASTSPTTVAGFASMKALSTRNDDPTRASRPWDKDRDGFVLGDGAGAMVLEEYEHARARGARIYCELSGFGMSADAHHMTGPHPDGPPPGAGQRKDQTESARDPAQKKKSVL
jgi:3-oxoacyl-[acyl-carrier-protein] synthase II